MNASSSRQARDRRRKGVCVPLTERDEALLQALARFRLARTSDLVRYAFPGIRVDTAGARLRRLFDAGYLAVLQPKPGVESVYRLGPAGRRHVAASGGTSGRVPRGSREHHLAIVRTWIGIALIEGLEIERCLPDWELREQFGVGELRVVPDLFLLIRDDESLRAVAVEVDCGTESRAVLDRKMEAYRSLWGDAPGLFGYDRFGVAVVCGVPSRRTALAASLKKAWVVPHVMWSGSESPMVALRTLFDKLSAPLEASPSRKGRSQSVSEIRDA